jgi:predicted metal-dependent HD superfamily phosphohydrolase
MENTGSKESKMKDIATAAQYWYDINWKSRHYHNWGHALNVVKGVQVIDENASPELLLAAYWHDAIYIPGAGSDANERCSAAALLLTGRSLTPDNMVVVDKAAQLILYTCIEIHLSNKRMVDDLGGDLGTLLDADLFSLCLPYEDFIQNQINIIDENGGSYPRDQGKSAAFLKQFLTCREFIYHTDFARSKWEQQARANIERYCKEQPLTE